MLKAEQCSISIQEKKAECVWKRKMHPLRLHGHSEKEKKSTIEIHSLLRIENRPYLMNDHMQHWGLVQEKNRKAS